MKPMMLYSLKSTTALLLFISFISIIAGSCRRPDQAGPNDSWCTSGINVQVVYDGSVPNDVKDMVYKMPDDYIGAQSALYNPNLRLIIIPFQFATDAPWNTMVSATTIRDAFFSTGTGSIKDYFSENSYGQFNIQEGFIANLVTLGSDASYYSIGQQGMDWTRNSTLAADICQRSNVNWAFFDVNGDRRISHNEAQICFMVSLSGVGAHRASTVTISTNISPYVLEADFVFLDCKRNDSPTRGTDDIRYNYSGIWHELSHGMFHLPDRYVDSIGCTSGRTGMYDIMSDNCSMKHMSMFDKMKLGWVQPRILRRPSQRSDKQRHCYVFPNSETHPAALVLWDNNQPDEYWIVENRYRSGSARRFETGLPESGLAIWWVNSKTNTLVLVDAGNLTLRPGTIDYSYRADQTGVLFKNRTLTRDETFNMQFLRSGTGFTEFAIRAASPEGETMYAEF